MKKLLVALLISLSMVTLASCSLGGLVGGGGGGELSPDGCKHTDTDFDGVCDLCGVDKNGEVVGGGDTENPGEGGGDVDNPIIAPPTEHECLFEELYAVPSTCAEAGYTVYSCTECGYAYSVDYAPASGHTPSDVVMENEVEATCTKEGNYDEVVYCLICNAEIKRESKTTNKTNHDYKDGVCTVCNAKMPSEGLRYILSSDDASYAVAGLGTCTYRDIVIPDSYNGLPVTTICVGAFWNSRLASIVIPDSVTTIGDSAFYGCYFTNITVSDDNNTYKSVDGNLYSKDGKTLVQYAVGKLDTTFEIPEDVTTIGRDAFRFCSSLQSIVIPEGVTTIEERAFWGCNGLTSFVIPDKVTTIGEYAFCDCDRLSNVVIGDSVTMIDEAAFYDCYSLSSVVMGDSVVNINRSVFYDCRNLTSIKYRGSEEAWDAIIKGSDWDVYWEPNGSHEFKINYTITYNYDGE